MGAHHGPPASARTFSVCHLNSVNPLETSNPEEFLRVAQKAHRCAGPADCRNSAVTLASDVGVGDRGMSAQAAAFRSGVGGRSRQTMTSYERGPGYVGLRPTWK